jgi:type III pantothenate kinase
MDLVLDAGNTETTAALFAGRALRVRSRIATDPHRSGEGWREWLLDVVRGSDASDPVATATAASVVPAVTAALGSAIAGAFGRDLLAIDWRTPLPIRIDLDDPTTVGADRIANVVAAHARFGGPCIVVDVGTAVTYECVTADGAFVGGAIAAGPGAVAEWMHRRTAQLPAVPVEAPARVIGRRTVEALQSGIFFGAIDAIDGMVRRIREEWGEPGARVVATGGLAALLAPHSATIRDVEPDLTLHGIRLVREHFDRQVGR